RTSGLYGGPLRRSRSWRQRKGTAHAVSVWNVAAGWRERVRRFWSWQERLSGSERGRTDRRTKRHHSAADRNPHHRWRNFHIHTCSGFRSAFRDADLLVLDVAEDATHALHNLLPFRGTVVRDANRWSQYLNAALDQFGADAQVLIAQHTWPVWGNERVLARLANQRDLYKYVHDQTIRMMNQGLGPGEIAESLTMPPGLENDWSARGYYGTLSHNSKAVYQRYLGWYDGNPANLNRLPRVEEAKKYLEYMGGSAAAITRARDDFK